MSLSAIVSMIIILSIVVGGFVYFLTRAIKKEKSQ
ncbi:MAG: MetS family NSS transporter small subunit [Ekhidna sp.]|nr:MetS family NSS transporter small subunit [Ekhidna sp.]